MKVTLRELYEGEIEAKIKSVGGSGRIEIGYCSRTRCMYIESSLRYNYSRKLLDNMVVLDFISFGGPFPENKLCKSGKNLRT